MIKASLCLKHRSIPPLAHLETPDPKIPFAELGLRLPRSLEPMPIGPDAACIAINSFGYGGTNAHAVLQEVATPAATTSCDREGVRGMHVLPISARSKPALKELAKALNDFWLRTTPDRCTTSAIPRLCVAAITTIGWRWLPDRRRDEAATAIVRGQSRC